MCFGTRRTQVGPSLHGAVCLHHGSRERVCLFTTCHVLIQVQSSRYRNIAGPFLTGMFCLILDSLKNVPNKAVWKCLMEKPKMITLYMVCWFLQFVEQYTFWWHSCFSPDRLWAAIPSPPSARHQQPIECLYRTTYPGTDCNRCTVMCLYLN